MEAAITFKKTRRKTTVPRKAIRDAVREVYGALPASAVSKNAKRVKKPAAWAAAS
jgi:hypothetical protein